MLHQERPRQQSTQSPSFTSAPTPLPAAGFRAGATHIQHQGSSINRDVVEDTENPLQLLAHATEHCLPLPQVSLQHEQPRNTLFFQRGTRSQGEKGNEMLRTFFGPPTVNLDIGPSLDPISLGLVTITEAEDLID